MTNIVAHVVGNRASEAHHQARVGMGLGDREFGSAALLQTSMTQAHSFQKSTLNPTHQNSLRYLTTMASSNVIGQNIIFILHLYFLFSLFSWNWNGSFLRWVRNNSDLDFQWYTRLLRLVFRFCYFLTFLQGWWCAVHAKWHFINSKLYFLFSGFCICWGISCDMASNQIHYHYVIIKLLFKICLDIIIVVCAWERKRCMGNTKKLKHISD